MPGRNDPCPCGSGRKFKVCCLAKERPQASHLNAAARQAARNALVWQADAVPLPITFRNDDAARPVTVLMVCANDVVLYCNTVNRPGSEAMDVAALLADGVEKAARSLGNYPEILLVRHGDVANELIGLFASKHIQVSDLRRLRHLDAAARSLVAHLSGVDRWPPVGIPSRWSGWGLPLHLIAQLFAASAAFWRAAPWKNMRNLQAPRARGPSGRTWTVCVMGNGGMQFGIALYARSDDLYRSAEGQTEAEVRAATEEIRSRVITLTFCDPRVLPKPLLREVRAQGWEVAAPNAVPLLMPMNTPAGGVSTDDVLDLIALLRAIPAFAAAHRELLDREARRHPIQQIRWRDPATKIDFRYPFDRAFHDPEFVSISDAIAQAGPNPSKDQWEHALSDAAHRAAASYNQKPQPELLGHSPEQVRRLLEGEWNAHGGAVHLRDSLALANFEQSVTVTNARTMLTLAAQDGLAITPAGYLKPAVVRELLDRFHGTSTDASQPQIPVYQLREANVGPVYVLRMLVQIAELLHKRGSRFLPTATAIRLLHDAHAGQLAALLFHTHFRTLNLAALDHWWDWPELQHAIAFTLCRLQCVAHEWSSPGELVSQVLLPYVRERAPRSAHFDAPAIVLESRVLRPLTGFGLMEAKRDGFDPAEGVYRKTPLFDAFLQFAI